MLSQCSRSDDEDDLAIDFNNAGLYLVGLQTCTAVATCAVVSVISCWILPSSAISAVRTLVFTAAVGIAIERKPIRIGRVRGVHLMYSSLRPSVAMYVSSLVLEQLVHTCVEPVAAQTAAWRKIIFQAMIVIMLVSGLIRARRPLSDTDLPFLITVAALIGIAILPPPAIALSGPLCEPCSLAAAIERVIRALSFAIVYSVFVYTSAPLTNTSSDIAVCVSRAAAASVWCLGCSPFLLAFGVPQCALVIFMRFQMPNDAYSAVSTTEKTIQDSPRMDMRAVDEDLEAFPASSQSVVTPDIVNGIGARSFVDIGGHSGLPHQQTTLPPMSSTSRANGTSHFSALQLAAIAATLPES